ncbi:MAG: CHAT domain-containing protein [Spirulinaceae cyanobacterium]
MKYLNWRLGVFLAFGLTVALPGQAQITVPLNNDTGTQLRIEGDRIEISGGTFSGDNTNLFHSFEQFNLNQNQIADFLANPTTQNILGRIMGGDPSLINGLLQVSNSNANLYLMNPAGIVFGAGARLNVGGDFFATTATGIGFDNNWFNAFGDNSYSDLIGTPNQFAFDLTEAGAIINNGDLQVNTHQNLTLLGGTVINTGNLTAPAGEITITAIPNTSLVRISQADSLLSLEIEPPRNSQGQFTNFTALDLPELLTATPDNFNVDLNTTSDGNIQLDNTIIPNETGVAIASGSLDVSGTTGGSLNVLGNKVAVISGNLNASGETSGGNIRIGGDFQGQGLIPNAVITIVDENSLINSNAGQIGDGGRTIVWADRTTKFDGTVTATGGQILGNGGFIEISGKENLSFDGTVNVSANNGSFGTILFDPRDIIIGTDTDDDAQLDPDIPNPGDPIGSIFANDGGTTTDFRISVTKLQSLPGVTNIVLQASRNIILDTDLTIEVDNVTLIAGNNFNGTGRNITLPGGKLEISANNITIGDINTSSIGGSGGNVTLNATGNVNTGNIDTSVDFSMSLVLNGGEVEIIAGESIVTGSIDTSAVAGITGTSTIEGGGVTLKAGSQPESNITFSSITTTAEESDTLSTATVSSGDVEILANGLVRGTDLNFNSNTIDTQALSNSPNTTNNSGDVTIQHDGGFGNVPFIVGDSAVANDPNRNGTVGGINAGNNTPLLSGTFPVAPNGDTSTPQPNITIISVNSPPVVAAFEPISIEPQSGQSSTSFTFNQLVNKVSDVDLDTNSITSANNAFTIFINEITPEGTLKLIRNNTEIVLSPGSSLVLQPGDILLYEPTADFTGEVNIFRLSADDNAAVSNPQPVTVNVVRDNSNIPDVDDNVFYDNDLEELDSGEFIDDPFFLGNEQANNAILELFETVETEYSNEYTNYLGLPPVPITSVDEAREILRNIERATGEKPALLYVLFTPSLTEETAVNRPKVRPNNTTEALELWRFSNNGLGELVQTPTPSNRPQNPSDPLELLLITANEPPIRVPVRGVTRAQMMAVAEDFRRTVTTASRPTAYQEPAQQLYEWMITPLKAEMEGQEITNIAFIMAPGLRSLPVAALYDGEEFLIEQYSVGLMASLSLTDTRYQDVKNLSVLAMGAEEFVQLQPLPAVPLELEVVTEKVWPGEAFLNEEFTIENLQGARSQTPHGIVHLATHAEFNPGAPENSYIQFWGDSQLSLNRLRELGLNNPPVELLVLSACRTAIGSATAELGFTGFAVQAGVKSGLGSLWYVSDAGTLALMSAFYEALQAAPIKAEAVRQAQLALLRGEVRFEQGALISRGLVVPLTPNFTQDTNRGLTHPYYWSGFTLVGSPW